MPTVPPEWEMRPASMEDRVATSRRIKAMFAPQPVLVPYEEWSPEINRLCQDKSITLATPTNFSPSSRGGARGGAVSTVDALLRYQELFYRTVYHDPTFTLDHSRLALPRDRLDDIKAALLRREVNYPLVVATPSVIPSKYLPNPDGKTRKERRGKTLHRFLFDHLIRMRRIPVMRRTDPGPANFLAQLRDLTLADLTLGPEDWKARGHEGIGPDGKPLAFTDATWLPYLQALYPTLPRPTVQPRYLDLSFVAWERDPPADRVVPYPGTQELPEGLAVAIKNKSQLDAVAFRYPLITPSRHLALFSQYHAATGEHLDMQTWSWMFGMIDPKRFPDGPSVRASWLADGLTLNRNDPARRHANSRLRASR